MAWAIIPQEDKQLPVAAGLSSGLVGRPKEAGGLQSAARALGKKNSSRPPARGLASAGKAAPSHHRGQRIGLSRQRCFKGLKIE